MLEVSHLEAELAEACKRCKACYLRYPIASQPQLIQLVQSLQVLDLLQSYSRVFVKSAVHINASICNITNQRLSGKEHSPGCGLIRALE